MSRIARHDSISHIQKLLSGVSVAAALTAFVSGCTSGNSINDNAGGSANGSNAGSNGVGSGSGNMGSLGTGNVGNVIIGNENTGNVGNENTGNVGNENTGNVGNENTGNVGNENTGNVGNENTGNVGNENTGSAGSGNVGNSGVALADDANVVFLHHSTGGVIWEGGIRSSLERSNAASGTSYAIEDWAYPTDPYPWENYPYDYYNIWVAHADAESYNGQATLASLTRSYDVVVFKHCFPVSEIGPDTGSPDISSSERTVENYTLQYEAIKARLRTYPNNRFVLWTGAALLAAHTSVEQAQRAHDFFQWVVETWDEPGDNIFVWDFRRLETNNGLYLTLDNAGAPDDSHPNNAFASRVAPLFVHRLVDVIEGRGDSGSVTGE